MFTKTFRCLVLTIFTPPAFHNPAGMIQPLLKCDLAAQATFGKDSAKGQEKDGAEVPKRLPLRPNSSL